MNEDIGMIGVIGVMEIVIGAEIAIAIPIEACPV
jgi:hypothetical protein